jgi:small subunit ribosomal protein S20
VTIITYSIYQVNEYCLKIRALKFWTNIATSCKIPFREYGTKDFLEDILANIKSQIKRNKQNEKRRMRNRVYSGSARTYVRKARVAIGEGGVDEARTAVLQAISALDKAAEKGIIHKNNAARRKSRLMKHLAALEQ